MTSEHHNDLIHHNSESQQFELKQLQATVEELLKQFIVNNRQACTLDLGLLETAAGNIEQTLFVRPDQLEEIPDIGLEMVLPNNIGRLEYRAGFFTGGPEDYYPIKVGEFHFTMIGQGRGTSAPPICLVCLGVNSLINMIFR